MAGVDEIETRTAHRRARKILSAVSLGLGVEDPFKVESGNEAIRFDAPVEQFWSSEAHRWKPSTKATNRRLIDHYLIPAFGAVAVADITQPMILKWRDGMSERAGTANRTLPVMSGMMRVAETMGLRPRRSNPCRFIQRYKANWPPKPKLGAASIAPRRFWKSENANSRRCFKASPDYHCLHAGGIRD